MNITLEAKNTTEERVLAYLVENASAVLAEKINAGNKTLAGCLEYAKGEARKLAKGQNCVCVPDDTVFGWIIHFFEEDAIAEKAVKAFKLDTIKKPAEGAEGDDEEDAEDYKERKPEVPKPAVRMPGRVQKTIAPPVGNDTEQLSMMGALFGGQ